MVKKIFFFLFLFFSLISTRPIFAEDTAELQKQYDEYNQKLVELAKSKNSLSNQIKIIDIQVAQTQLKIKSTTDSITTIEKEIDELTGIIGNLDISLNDLTALYLQQIVQNYKLQKKIPVYSLLLFGNLNDYLENYKYLSQFQRSSQDTLVNLETTRTDLDQQKQIKAQKQSELEALKKSLASQQKSLSSQKNSKSSLLEITKNDEKKYQLLLQEVESKLGMFNNSSEGCLSSSPSRDNNYYSQLDPIWCRRYIGIQTKYTIGGAGCYLTSMSMVLKKLGVDIDPLEYASDPSRFTSTADLTAPQVPSGYVYKKYIGYSSSVIDNEINNGRYIIAQVPMRGSPSGYHFITIISGSNGNYKMHDPVHGANLNFSSYYSTSSIISLRLITK